MAPMLRPSIRSRRVREGVNETVVPGHTRTSPPPETRSTAVSEPAVTADPDASRLPASTIAPDPPVTGTTIGAAPNVKLAAVGTSDGFLPALRSPAGFRR